jgi:hypothetical protein
VVSDNTLFGKEPEMRTKRTVFCVCVLLLSGCLPSLHQLYTDETLIFEEGLVGKWRTDGDDIWQFRRAEEKGYELRIYETQEECGRFEAHLVEIDGRMFLDLYPDDEAISDLDDFYALHLLPVHTFIKVNQILPTLQLHMMDPGKVEEMLKNDPNAVKHEIADESIVLTATTEQLQAFLVTHVETLFGHESDNTDDAEAMTRLEPLYTDEDIVFDANLIGQWKGNDGEILDAKKMGKNAYHLMLIEKDGEAHQLFANLLQVNGRRFLAVFWDKSELSPNETYAYAFHLIPDEVVKIEQTKQDLTLRRIDYDQISRVLNSGSLEDIEKAADLSHFFEGVRIKP